MADKQTGKPNFFSKLFGVLSGAPDQSVSGNEETGKYAPVEKESIDVTFVKNLTQNGGQFVYCGSNEELTASFKKILDEYNLTSVGSPDNNLMSFLKKIQVPNLGPNLNECDTICTYCEALIASNGGIMVNDQQTSGVRIDEMPSHHIVIGRTSQLVDNLHGAMSHVNHKYRNNRPSQIGVLKGPNDESVRLADADPNKNRFIFLLLVEDSF